MSAQFDHPNDLQFLMSRSLDGDLSNEESALLERALAEGSNLQSEFAELRAVDWMVKEWGGEPIEIDWTAHQALIQAKIASDPASERDAARVDQLLEDWAQRTITKTDLRDRVLAEIQKTDHAVTPLRRMIRVGLPLAAAAAIALAILMPNLRKATAPAPHSIVSIGPGVQGEPLASATPTTVLFDRSPASRTLKAHEGGIELIVVGSMAPEAPVEESAPL